MKKSMILLGILAMGYANAQTDPEYNGRIGVNIDLPKSSLHIGRHTGIPANSPQGLILPHLSTEQRDEFERTKLTNGLMIFNTTKNCIDWWNGTKWTCTDGTQADIPLPPTTPISLPNIEIGNSMYWFSSIYDDDYLSNATSTPTLAIPTAPASLAVQAADGVASGGTHEPILNVQGKIPAKANALKVAIPINIIVDGILPEFSTSMRIPAIYTKNNQSGIVTLSWEKITAKKTNYFEKTQSYLTAKIYAENEEIELKQLDLIAGLGADHMGIFMGSFKYPRTKTESEGPKANWTGHYDLHLISGIPDKHFNKLTNLSPEGAKYRHRFIYAPLFVPKSLDEGMTFLNNNLGANYANIYHEKFNTNQLPISSSDYHAFGSAGQWGRIFDGHELINWTDHTTYNHPYNLGMYPNSNLTQFYDNCPTNWKTPNKNERFPPSVYTLSDEYVGKIRLYDIPRKYGSGVPGNIDATEAYWASDKHTNPNKAYVFGSITYSEYDPVLGGWQIVYHNYADRETTYPYYCIKK